MNINFSDIFKTQYNLDWIGNPNKLLKLNLNDFFQVIDFFADSNLVTANAENMTPFSATNRYNDFLSYMNKLGFHKKFIEDMALSNAVSIESVGIILKVLAKMIVVGKKDHKEAIIRIKEKLNQIEAFELDVDESPRRQLNNYLEKLEGSL